MAILHNMNTLNGTNGAAIDLPDKNCPTLALLHPTEKEKLVIWSKNGSEWKGALTSEAYFRREKHLSRQDFTKDGGITYWVLVDTAAKERIILSACESYRKKAFVSRNGNLEEVVSHGIGSVFCPPECRKRGYAGTMMKKLGDILRTWQAPGEKGCAFSILYSDIGKKFYAAYGWEPFNSAHVSIQHEANLVLSQTGLPTARPLYADDLPELCAIDETLIRNRMLKDFSTDKTQIALIPDIAKIRWHHAREEFVARELVDKVPKVKGAIVGTEPGKRVWCYWNRMFYNSDSKASKGNTLHILRLVIEEQGMFDWERGSKDVDKLQYVPAITALFEMARKEAEEWNMADVEIWNPTDATVKAVRYIQPDAEVVHRDDESIASLMWFGDRTKIEWLGNEKYGWC